ncbi:BRO-N domain-containing protein [Gilliamella sp. G0441]|uniref:BRO-N domain-containing protein n=1 Tax=Gilliamella sp. G0441 TaxID=3384760 RepID=UPI003D34A91F
MEAIKMIVKQDELSVIKFDGIEVRIITHLGEPWFIAVDVCNALEIKNVTNAIKSLNENEKALYSIKGITRGNEFVNAISESGFYKLIARSRKAIQQGTFAYRFSNWVFGEVIPTIRKTGDYGVPWAFLNDHAKREKEYRIESSRRGRNLEACKKWKANLIAEERALWAKYQPELVLI